MFGDRFPGQVSAGVLTADDGEMFLVVTPCGDSTFDEIAMKYTPPGAAPNDGHTPDVVIRYVADVPMAPPGVRVPLDPTADPPAGWTLVEVDEDLMANALRSSDRTSFDDSFYVEAQEILSDGRRTQLGASWSAEKSRPDTVVLHDQTFDDPFGRGCDIGSGGWAVEPTRGSSATSG